MRENDYWLGILLGWCRVMVLIGPHDQSNDSTAHPHQYSSQDEEEVVVNVELCVEQVGHSHPEQSPEDQITQAGLHALNIDDRRLDSKPSVKGVWKG